MNTRTLLSIITCSMTLATCSFGAELIKNGNLQNDLNYWELNQHKGYVPAPQTHCKNGVLSFSGLSFLTKNYLSLGQAVEIKKEVKYKLSYDIKGPATKTYNIRLGDPGDRKKDIKPTMHYKDKDLSVTADWKTVEVEFTGKFDTDSNWYRKVSQARKNNTLNKKGVAKTPKAAGHVKVDAEDRPCTTTLQFLIGSLEGKLSIRNISIEEAKTN